MVEASNLITRDHYVFKGWKCGEEVVDDEFTIPAEDIILVAYYEKEKYDIKYYINFGSKMYFDTIEVEYQDTLAGTVPSDADIADLIGDNGDAYRLLSITYDNETYTKAEFEAEFTSINSDMEILINLEKYKLFVNFYGGDGDNLYTSKQINKTQDFVLPQEPSSEYAPSSQEVGTTYEFGGWLYNGKMFDEDFDFTNIETDIDVYSEWYEYNYTKWSYEMNQGTASITGPT